MDILDVVRRRVESGERISDDEALALLREGRPADVGRLADGVRRARHGNNAYYRVDLNLNHTNVCAADCDFCAFYAKPGSKRAYTMTLDDVEAKAARAAAGGVNEFHVVGGLDPDLPIEYFEEMFRRLKRVAPHAEIQGLTGVEIDFLAKIERMPIRDVLVRLRDAGLDSLPGGGAEIFHPDARKRMGATKIAGDRFLAVHEEAHALGIPTNVSILFGHVETHEERVDHLRRVRELQDRTGGFRAFVNLVWNPENTTLAADTGAGAASAPDILKFIAVSRLYLDNIEHIKLPWVTVGKPLAQVSLSWGVDDVGGAAFEERILEAAGGRTWQDVTESDLPRLFREAGFTPVAQYGSYRDVRGDGDAEPSEVVA